MLVIVVHPYFLDYCTISCWEVLSGLLVSIDIFVKKLKIKNELGFYSLSSKIISRLGNPISTTGEV
jgi:hypothetical protein